MGNLRSVEKAFDKMGAQITISSKHEDIAKADKIILPGVGAFKDGMKNLASLDLLDLLRDEVVEKKKPFLGICLGMQLLAKKSHENGIADGLGWIDAEVVKFDFTGYEEKLKVPHVGWNNILLHNTNPIFNDIKDRSDFYFVHSYYFKTNSNVVTSYTNYGFDFVSSVKHENIYACQFHPEKSQSVGLKLIENFIHTC